MFAGSAEPEVEGDVHVGKRGNVEMFRHAELKRATGDVSCVGAERVGFDLVKSVGDLCERGDGLAVAVVAKIEGDGFEEIAEDPRERDEENAAAGEVDPTAGEVVDHALLKRRRDLRVSAVWGRGIKYVRLFFRRGGVVGGRESGKVVAFPEGVEVGAIDRKKAQATVERVELVEIEGYEEQPIHKPVVTRGEPMVHHMALVETGLHGWSGGTEQ